MRWNKSVGNFIQLQLAEGSYTYSERWSQSGRPNGKHVADSGKQTKRGKARKWILFSSPVRVCRSARKGGWVEANEGSTARRHPALPLRPYSFDQSSCLIYFACIYPHKALSNLSTRKEPTGKAFAAGRSHSVGR